MNKNAPIQLDDSRIVPVMRYRDIDAAIEWLCATFGFEKHLVVKGDDGATFYAQLTYGTGMIMVGSGQNFELDPVLRQPQDIGGDETQCCYLVVEDVDAHYEKAKAAGAQIVLDIKGDKSGARGYSCRDPHGHIWNFGAYNPWNGKSSARTAIRKYSILSHSRWQFSMAFAGFLALFVGLGTFALWATGSNDDDLETIYAHEIAAPLDANKMRSDLERKTDALSVKRATKEQLLKAEHEALEREEKARKQAEQKLNELAEDLARIKREQQNTQKAASKSKEELERERKLRQDLAQSLLKMRQDMEEESKLTQSAKDHSQELQRELEAIRVQRIAALKAAQEIHDKLRLEQAAKQALQQKLLEARLETEELRKGQEALKAQQASEEKRRKRKARKAKRKRKTVAKKTKKKKIPKPTTTGIFGL